MIRGQTLVGEFCAWCGEAAEGRITIEPPRKEGGEWKDGRDLPACGQHMESVQAGEPMGWPLRRKARGVEQLNLTDTPGPQSAITGG